MLWPVHIKKTPRASKHLCPARLQTRCDVCCACQFICVFIPSDSDMGMQGRRSTEVFAVKDCAWLCASLGSRSQTLPFAAGFLVCENDGMCSHGWMLATICACDCFYLHGQTGVCDCRHHCLHVQPFHFA